MKAHGVVYDSKEMLELIEMYIKDVSDQSLGKKIAAVFLSPHLPEFGALLFNLQQMGEMI